MANTGAKLSSFPEVNDIQTGDMFPLLSGGDTNAKIDYATLANAIIAKLKSEDVVQTQTNNNNKIPSAGLVYGMNETIEDLQESTSTEQEEKSVTAEIVTVDDADGGEAGLTLNLEPTQSGSGDPSPDNVRPITGWTGVKVYHSGQDTSDPIVYDLTFPSEAGTVYGGSLDVTNGVLTVDRIVDTKTWSKLTGSTPFAANTRRKFIFTNAPKYILANASEDLLCNLIGMYNTAYSNDFVHMYIANSEYAWVFLPSDTDADTEIQLSYTLAAPVTYQLTPIEVATLLGDNTIWMDAEGTIKLDYKTNAVATKGDVNDALARIKALAKITEAIAPVESSYTATQNYAIGDYLIVDYKLYKVTAAITSGATITEGTNVTATTIMAEIKALT